MNFMSDSERLKGIVQLQNRQGEILQQVSDTLSTIQQQSQDEESRQRDVMLDRYQLKTIPIEKQRFNPESMVAGSLENNPKAGDGVVLSEIRPGFYWHDSVLRRAEVSVNRHQDV